MKNILIILITIFFIDCSNNKSYSVKGTIIEVRQEANEFLIHHDEIPNFMMAMTMPFKLSDSLDIFQYKRGDSVSFKLVLNDQLPFAEKFILLGKGTLPVKDDWSDEFSSLEIGEIFSDVSFLDIDSSVVSLSNSDGKFRFISYIFTRCPMPNMCPALVVKNQYLAQAFSAISDIEFILVSFDYLYDTPTILKMTYKNLLNTNNNLKAYSSYGHINDIFTLAGQSFVSFWGIEENDIGHSLRSVLIDPERRLLKAYDGLDWDPKETEKDIKNILTAYRN